MVATRCELHPAVRFMADPVRVDPLGSCAMGMNAFPEIFLGSRAIRPIPPGLAKGRVTWLPMCIPPRARANELGRANASASAIVVSFMAVSFAFQIGNNRAGAIKLFFSDIHQWPRRSRSVAGAHFSGRPCPTVCDRSFGTEARDLSFSLRTSFDISRQVRRSA